MDIQKEMLIAGKQKTVFMSGTELRLLYDAFVTRWELNCGSFAASVFYQLGRTHGIREERARRNK